MSILPDVLFYQNPPIRLQRHYIEIP
jgi:hypothetical protein